MPQERLYTIIARVNPETGTPLIGEATFLTGYGSVKLRAGRSDASVPESVAKALKASRNDIDIIPSEQFGDAPAPMQMPADTAAAIAAKHAAAEQKVQAAVDNDEMVEVEIGGQKVLVPASVIAKAATPVVEKDKVAEGAAERAAAAEAERKARVGDEAALAAAREALEAEGEEVPDPVQPTGNAGNAGASVTLDGRNLTERTNQAPSEPRENDGEQPPVRVVPPGFEDRTEDGEPRCLAAKGDGTQCKNAAIDAGPACRIDAHQKQFDTGE